MRKSTSLIKKSPCHTPALWGETAKFVLSKAQGSGRGGSGIRVLDEQGCLPSEGNIEGGEKGSGGDES